MPGIFAIAPVCFMSTGPGEYPHLHKIRDVLLPQ
jgi:hypothetical protein